MSADIPDSKPKAHRASTSPPHQVEGGSTIEPDVGSQVPSSIVGGRSPADETTLPGQPFSGSPTLPGLPRELHDHPRYRVVAILGTGGMGSVYRAEHRLMDRPVALKVIRGDLLGDSTLVERFRREVKAAARLGSHPNVVAAFDAEQAGETHLLVMEFIEGTDLARLVDRRGPLPVGEACEYVRQAALGLQHAFEDGMVHRDIKPQNLMRTTRGQVKILDFGLARFASEVSSQGGLTAEGAMLGTINYIAPEQIDDSRSADIRADIYSLGCTLYHLLAGRVPFPDGNLIQKAIAHQESAPVSLAELRADVRPKLARIVERMMAKKPAARFQTPGEVARALAPFADAQATRTAPTSLDRAVGAGMSTVTAKTPSLAPTAGNEPPRSWRSSRSEPRRQRTWIPIVAGAGLLVLGAAALTAIISRGRAVVQPRPDVTGPSPTTASAPPTTSILPPTQTPPPTSAPPGRGIAVGLGPRHRSRAGRRDRAVREPTRPDRRGLPAPRTAAASSTSPAAASKAVNGCAGRTPLSGSATCPIPSIRGSSPATGRARSTWRSGATASVR